MSNRLRWIALLIAISGGSALAQAPAHSAVAEQTAWLRHALVAKGCSVASSGEVMCPDGLECAIDGRVMICSNERVCLIGHDGLNCKTFAEVAALTGTPPLASPPPLVETPPLGTQPIRQRPPPGQHKPTLNGRCQLDAAGLMRCSDGSAALLDSGGLSRFNDGSSAITNKGGLTRFSNGQSAITDGGGVTRFSDGSWCQTDASGLVRCYSR